MHLHCLNLDQYPRTSMKDPLQPIDGSIPERAPDTTADGRQMLQSNLLQPGDKSRDQKYIEEGIRKSIVWRRHKTDRRRRNGDHQRITQ